jgi:hypothetical protein
VSKGRNLFVFCEPQCWGFEHATFNAALLNATLIAEPDANCIFMGEGEHLASIRRALADGECRPMEERIEWREIRIPPRNVTGWRRLRSEGDWFAVALNVAVESGARFLILTSITETGLLKLKAKLMMHRSSAPVLATIHGALASIERPQPRRPWHWTTSLRQVLRLPHPRQLTYWVLGPSIRASLAETMPEIVSQFAVLDPPYFMQASDCDSLEPRGTIRFGFLGVGHTGEKGFGEFVRLAQEITQNPSLPASEFVLVGFLEAGVRSAEGLPAAVRNISSTPLSPDEYDTRAHQLTYAIGIADPDHYRLVASASFLDALRYGKPGIYLRNRYLEFYFEKLGDIGYLCASYDEVRDVVVSILEKFPEARYRRQCENIQRGRQLFAPQRVATQLSAALAQADLRLHKSQ